MAARTVLPLRTAPFIIPILDSYQTSIRICNIRAIQATVRGRLRLRLLRPDLARLSSSSSSPSWRTLHNRFLGALIYSSPVRSHADQSSTVSQPASD